MNLSINNMKTLYESILDIEDNIDDFNNNLIGDFEKIFSCKTKQEFNNFCEILSKILIDKQYKSNDVVCNISYLKDNNSKYYTILIGKPNKSKRYRIYFAYGGMNIEDEKKAIRLKSLSDTDVVGAIPDKIRKTIKFI